MLGEYFAVGKIYKDFVNHKEEVRIDMDTSGIIIYIFFDGMTKEESANIGGGSRFEIRFLELEDMLMFSIKCGNLNWMDAPYSPHLGLSRQGIINMIYKDNTGIPLTLIGVDSVTGIIKNIRLVGMGTEFSNYLLESAHRLKNKEFNMTSFDHNLQTIYKVFTSEQLAYGSKYRFVIDE